VVKACNDTVESFEMKHQSIIQQIVNTMDEKGFPMYFPILDKTIVFPNTTLNMLQAWHSIESIFRLMEEHEREQQQYDPHHWTNYTRIAMLRANVVFMTKIDIYAYHTLEQQNVTTTTTATTSTTNNISNASTTNATTITKPLPPWTLSQDTDCRG